jgi:PKD repeat protein
MKNFHKKIISFSRNLCLFLLFTVGIFSSTLSAQCTGGKYYIQDFDPWGMTHNQTAFNAIFGSGNWTQGDYSTSATTIFSNANCFVMLEGGESNSNFPAFMVTNQTLIENWVAAGGKLYIQAAPNYTVSGNTIPLGFSGSSLTTWQFNNDVTLTTAGISTIGAGPITSTATSYTGNSFGHSVVIGTGLTNLIEGISVSGSVVLAFKNWGSGSVYISGSTAPPFQNPNPQSFNLLNNIIAYSSGYNSSSITITGTLSAFATCTGLVSAEQSFSINGAGLTTDIMLTAPTGFEISTSSNSGFGSSVSLTPVSGTVNSTPIYVRLAINANGSPSGNIVCTSTGVTTQNVAANGTVSSLPTATITGGTTVCSGANSPNITFTSSGGTAPYTFGYKINGGTTQTATTVLGNFINVSAPTNISGSFIYQLVSVSESSSNACSNLQNGSDSIIVNQSPDVIQPSNLNACAGDSTSAINFTGSLPGTVYNWTNNNPGIGLAASGSGNIASFTATNATASPLIATITVTPSTSAAVQLIANGSFETGSLSPWTNTGFGALGICGSTNQDWKVSTNGAIGTGCQNPGDPTSGSYAAYNMFDASGALTYRMYQTITLPSNITTATLGYLYAYTASFYGLPRIFSINIYNAANTTKLATLDNVNINDGSGSLSWTSKNVNVASILAPFAGQTVIFDLSVQIQQGWTGAAGFGVDNVSLDLNSGAVSCSGTSKTFNITVVKPTASIGGTSTVCLNATSPNITFTGSTGTAPYTFTYNINGGINQTVTTTSGSSVTVAAPTDTAGSFVYNLVSVSDGSSCSQSLSDSATITIALPAFTATKTSYNGSDLSCAGISDGKITITNPTGTGPFEYSKNNGSAYQPSNVFANLSEDTYSIKVRDSFGCISNATVVTITSVNPISATAISNAPVCAGTPLVLSGSALGGTGSYTYSWTASNNYASDTTNSDTTTISVAALATNGLFNLEVRDANNCVYNVSTNVVIYPSPILSSTAAPVANTICKGTSTTITFTNGATTLNPAVFTTAYSNNFSSSIGNSWTFPAITPTNVPSIQNYNGDSILGYLSNQQAKLNLTSLPSHDSITVDFDLYIHDTWDGNSAVSGPDMFRVILDNDTTLNTTFSNETWNSTSQSYPNNFHASNASYTGSLTRTLPTACNFGGGSLSAKYHITKTIAHAATSLEMILEASGLENVCNESWSIDNVTVQYRSQSSNSNATWTNPSLNNTPITVSPLVNTYYVANLNGCLDSIQIIVNPTPVAGFTINTVNQCVTGNSYDFTNTTTLAGGGAMTYAWTMTGATNTSATTPNVTGNTYANHGSYNVRLVATSVIGNCNDSIGSATETISVSPRVQITQSLPNPICAGNSVRLTANQVMGGSSAVVYTPTYTDNFETSIGNAWSFPAIIPANVPTVQSYNGQNVLGYLTNQKAIHNQTGLAAHDYVKVEFDLYLHDSWDGNSTDSIGGSLIGKDIWKMSVNGSNIISTTFSNFSYRTQAYPNNISAINLNGTDAVSNTLPTRCNHNGGALSSLYHISKIIPHTSSSFNLELEALGLEELCNESWSIDNFNVELGVNTATPTLLSACNGLPLSGGPIVYTVNHSNNFQTSIGSAWSFPAISPANEPTLSEFNGDSVLGFLTNQQAIYTQSGLSAHEYVKVEFDLYLHDTWDGNDPSTGVDSWKMNVDGNSVINTTFSNFSYRTQAYPNNAPAVNANFTGSVNSSLPARCNLGGGAPSSKYRISKIVPHNASSISIVLEALGLEELCNESWSIDNFQLSLGAGSAPVSSATWNGGAITGATSCFTDITPTTSTDYTVTIGACTSPITNIDVRPAPTPSFTISNASCSKTVSFTNTNIEADVTYLWNFGDGSAVYSGTTAPNHTYSAIGTYTVTLSANILGGCTQTTTRTIKIADAPTAGIAFTGGTGCGNSVQFTNTSTIPSGNTASYLWSFGETPVSDTSTQESPLHSYVADGNYTVTLTVSTGTNCSASTTVSVNALAAVTGNQAIFTATVGGSCGNMVTTTNSSTGTNNQYAWDFGDGSVSSEVTPTHYYTAGGFKTITLTILNGVGCATTSNKIVNISDNSGANGRVGVDFAITPNTSQVLLTNDFGFEPTFTNYPNNVPVVYCAGAPTWTYGDGTGSSNTIIYSKRYAAAGTYTVRIVQQTTNTGCFAEASKTVTVLPNPLLQNNPISFKDGKIASLNNEFSTGLMKVNSNSNNLTLYPNPNKGTFKFQLNSNEIINGEIKVVDLLGRDIYKANINGNTKTESIDLNSLSIAPGTYNLVILNNGNVYARKAFVIIAE